MEIWKCREGEQLRNVTTLIQDPEAGGHCLRSWTRIYGLLGVSEAIQRELVLLSLMLEQPSFVPLDMLIGELENPCALADANDRAASASRKNAATLRHSPPGAGHHRIRVQWVGIGSRRLTDMTVTRRRRNSTALNCTPSRCFHGVSRAHQVLVA